MALSGELAEPLLPLRTVEHRGARKLKLMFRFGIDFGFLPMADVPCKHLSPPLSPPHALVAFRSFGAMPKACFQHGGRKRTCSQSHTHQLIGRVHGGLAQLRTQAAEQPLAPTHCLQSLLEKLRCATPLPIW